MKPSDRSRAHHTPRPPESFRSERPLSSLAHCGYRPALPASRCRVQRRIQLRFGTAYRNDSGTAYRKYRIQKTAYIKHTSQKDLSPPGNRTAYRKYLGTVHRNSPRSVQLRLEARSASLGGAFSLALGRAVRCRFGGCRSPLQHRVQGIHEPFEVVQRAVPVFAFPVVPRAAVPFAPPHPLCPLFSLPFQPPAPALLNPCPHGVHLGLRHVLFVLVALGVSPTAVVVRAAWGPRPDRSAPLL